METSREKLDWLAADNVAVITGGASGIGLAAARALLDQGMKVAIADRDADGLHQAAEALRENAASSSHLLAQVCDVGDLASVEALAADVASQLGPVSCLMNNAGAATQCGQPWENAQAWKDLLQTNLWGVIHGCQAFMPSMLAGGHPAVVINTGSKQGITKPPGNYAYNLSKAGVVAYTECLAHALRQQDNCSIRAQLLIPGFTYTGLVAPYFDSQPDAAWTSEQVVDFMFESLSRGDFYILCPDNDVTREMDEKRIQWSADDLIKNRPALSRWHPDHEAHFARFMGE